MSRPDHVLDPAGNRHEITHVEVLGIRPGVTQLELSDGTSIDLHVAPLTVHRINGQWDSDGFPIYGVTTQIVTQIASCDQSLLKQP
ncbi:MAG: hypothetical protein OXG25_06625 [Gammaproteobacteria bacterium]|nr:hypothetical protein [Gammaproteobacteria bacterium]